MEHKRDMWEILRDILYLEGKDVDCAPLFQEMVDSYGILFLPGGDFTINEAIDCPSKETE